MLNTFFIRIQLITDSTKLIYFIYVTREMSNIYVLLGIKKINLKRFKCPMTIR